MTHVKHQESPTAGVYPRNGISIGHAPALNNVLDASQLLQAGGARLHCNLLHHACHLLLRDQKGFLFVAILRWRHLSPPGCKSVSAGYIEASWKLNFEESVIMHKENK